MKKIALVQMTSTTDQERNIETALSFVRQASSDNADLIAFPENFLLLGDEEQYIEAAEPIPGRLTRIFQQQAKENHISILMGSLYEKNPDNPAKAFNTTVLIDRNGQIRAKYSKIHLFDVSLPNLKLYESNLIEPGNEIIVCDHEIGRIGFTICYDIRFPNLYQQLTKKGAQIIFVPAAFTVPTGKAHWLNLLRSRAIENQVFIAAPAQYGKHSPSRESFGSTVLIDPWGDILSLLPDKEGIIYGEIDLNIIEKVRAQIPISLHKVKGIDF